MPAPDPSPITAWHWAGFVALVLVFLALDLGVFHRSARVVKVKEAMLWTAFWVGLTALFAWAFAVRRGPEEALQFLTGYVIEMSLSMDNVFAIALIFAWFGVEPARQHRTLFWGILGALVMRGLMIGGGAALIQRFHWLLYALGVFLVVTGLKWGFSKQEVVRPEKNAVVRLARKFMPITEGFDGQKFFSMIGGRRALTPLALALLMVETTDLVFAADSIPAIFAVTQNAFIVFTSNVFAILGLRSLYFLLAGAIQYFRHLKAGLAFVLVFIGAKMLAAPWRTVPTVLSLAIVGLILAVAVGFSAMAAWREKKAAAVRPKSKV